MLCNQVLWGNPRTRKAGFLAMHSLALRCLIALLSLALVGGSSRAGIHLAAVHHEPCPAEIGHTHTTIPDRHHSDADRSCCCDCLACVSAINLSPDLTNSVPAFPAGLIRYCEVTSFLAGRALLPEPDPPRPSILT